MKHFALIVAAALVGGCATTATTTGTDELPEYKQKQRAYYSSTLAELGTNDEIREKHKDNLCTTERVIRAKHWVMIKAERSGVVELSEPMPVLFEHQPEAYKTAVRQSCTCQTSGICMPIAENAHELARRS